MKSMYLLERKATLNVTPHNQCLYLFLTEQSCNIYVNVNMALFKNGVPIKNKQTCLALESLL